MLRLSLLVVIVMVIRHVDSANFQSHRWMDDNRIIGGKPVSVWKQEKLSRIHDVDRLLRGEPTRFSMESVIPSKESEQFASTPSSIDDESTTTIRISNIAPWLLANLAKAHANLLLKAYEQ